MTLPLTGGSLNRFARPRLPCFESLSTNGETLALWSAICRGLGITADVGPATQAQPALRTPSRIAWTNGMIEQIRAGEGQHGSTVAPNCTACHGEGGQNTSMIIPSLAGMDAQVI
jgi:cytochrome c553